MEELVFAKLRPPRAPAPRALTSVTVSCVMCVVVGVVGLGARPRGRQFFYFFPVQYDRWSGGKCASICVHSASLASRVWCLALCLSLPRVSHPPPPPRCVSRPRDTRRVRTNVQRSLARTSLARRRAVLIRLYLDHLYTRGT